MASVRQRRRPQVSCALTAAIVLCCTQCRDHSTLLEPIGWSSVDHGWQFVIGGVVFETFGLVLTSRPATATLPLRIANGSQRPFRLRQVAILTEGPPSLAVTTERVSLAPIALAPGQEGTVTLFWQPGTSMFRQNEPGFVRLRLLVFLGEATGLDFLFHAPPVPHPPAARAT